jgi:hypothetical protein
MPYCSDALEVVSYEVSCDTRDFLRIVIRGVEIKDANVKHKGKPIRDSCTVRGIRTDDSTCQSATAVMQNSRSCT